MGFTKYSTCSSAVALVLTLLGAAVVLTLQPASAQVFSSCTASMLSTFTPCLNYLTGSSNGGSSPTADCCDAVGGLLSSSTDCACLILTGNIPFRIPINRTLAVSLPRVCSSKSVSLFQCNGPPPGDFETTPCSYHHFTHTLTILLLISSSIVLRDTYWSYAQDHPLADPASRPCLRQLPPRHPCSRLPSHRSLCRRWPNPRTQRSRTSKGSNLSSSRTSL